MAAAARCSTVSDDAIVAVAAEIEVGIAPGVEFGRSAQSLTGADGAGALPGVVDDGDGDGVTALQFAQEGEQRRDFAADILIDAMQAHERIEDEQPRLQRATVSSRRARSASRSRRRLGAVITWTSSSARAAPAAAQMPSRRRRTTCSASSAG